MTVLDQTRGQTSSMEQPGNGRSAASFQPHQETNVGQTERTVSIAAGSVLALLGLSRASVPGLVVAGVGGAMLYRGITGHCHGYDALGISTADDQLSGPERAASRGIHVEQAFLINRSPEDLYKYWRNFENLPAIMTHLQSVSTTDERRSHWVATAPKIAGGKVEWDAEITEDQPNSRIAWRSLPGSQIDTTGDIRFSPASGDRGTEVHVFMNYLPPGGKLGHWIATVFGEGPRRQMRDDLRNFKRIMECGEIPTTDGQPHGNCTGRSI